GCEASSVDGAVEHAWCIDAVTGQCCDQGQRLPTLKWNAGLQSAATGCPAPDRRHVGLGPGLIDRVPPSWIEAALVFLPQRPPARDFRTALLAWHNGFLKSSVPQHGRSSKPFGSRPSFC